MKPERIHWIDVAKGILILLLLIHHFTTATERNGIDLSQYPFMTSWTVLFTSFFIQAFFFMSGYCSNFEKSASTFFYGIIKQLVVPIFFFNLITCFFYAKSFSFKEAILYWVDNEGNFFWFLNALLVSKVFIWCFIKWFKSEIILLVISFLLLIGAVYLKQEGIGIVFMCIKQSIGSIFFVALGYVCKKVNTFEKLKKWGGGYPYILLLLLFFHIAIPTFMGSMRVSLKSLPIFLLLSITGTMAFVNACERVQYNRILEFFGRNTLLIYGFHFIPLMLYFGYLYEIVHPVFMYEKVLLVVLVYILEILTMVLLICLFRYKPFKWMLGKF